MPIYNLDVEGTEFNGTQTWEVEADSAKKAIELFESGEGVFVCEEIEVSNHRKPELDEVYEVESSNVPNQQVDDIDKENIMPNCGFSCNHYLVCKFNDCGGQFYCEP